LVETESVQRPTRIVDVSDRQENGRHAAMTTFSIEKFSASDRKKAEALLSRVDDLLDKASEAQKQLHKNYVEVGLALIEIKKTNAWMLRSHSYEAYVKEAGEKFNRGRTALYGYASVAERLLPSVAKQDLIDMGVTNAGILAQMVKVTGKTPTATLVANAKSMTEEEFKATVAEASGLRTTDDKGKFFDLGSVYFSPDERKEFERAVRAAAIANEFEQAVDWKTASPTTRKIILQAWLAEFLSGCGQ
jgi:hypothetical protein